ncbi:uncharacterized protein LOC143484417 [Brachyhypopomus gauderio]|uniref:uncharacterized protein LOC143484417 n=1 Tax=Brachyhypopomus gauderio TaxID=698409 RepID=UPI0040438196
MAHASTSSICSECIKLSQRVAELQERIHTLHSIREEEEYLDSILATQTADKTVPVTGKERDVSLHCRWDVLGAKPKLILASTPNPVNNNNDKGWTLVRGKERSRNQYSSGGKQQSSEQNILLDNRYEALASTEVAETEQSHHNILPPSPGHQGHQTHPNQHQRSDSSLAAKLANNSGHSRTNHQAANCVSQQHANKHAKRVSHRDANHVGHRGGNHVGHRGGNHVGHRGGNHVGHRGGNHAGHRGGNHVGHRGGNHVGHRDANHVSRRGINGERRRGTPPQPKTLLIGDSVIRDVWSNSIKVFCFPRVTVCEVIPMIPHILHDHPATERLIVHVGSSDVYKQQSEILKQDFNHLFDILEFSQCEVFISGPIPTARRGSGHFTRLLALNSWLTTACAHRKGWDSNACG